MRRIARLRGRVSCVVCERRRALDDKAYLCCGICLPLMQTVYHHFQMIFGGKHPSYKGMPYHPGWNPDKGGSFVEGARYLLKHLGSKNAYAKTHGVPVKNISIHVLPPHPGKPWGFVPGGVVYAGHKRQSAEKAFKLLAAEKAKFRLALPSAVVCALRADAILRGCIEVAIGEMI